MIRQKHRFQFSISLLFLAYAYLVTGYPAAALFFGIASFLTALLFHSAGTLNRNLNQVLISALIQAGMIRGSGLEQSFPEILVLAVLNAAVSSLWLCSSRKAVRETMQVLSLACASLLVSGARSARSGNFLLRWSFILFCFRGLSDDSADVRSDSDSLRGETDSHFAPQKKGQIAYNESDTFARSRKL